MSNLQHPARSRRVVSPQEYERLLQQDRFRRGIRGFVIKIVPLLAALWLGWGALVAQGLGVWVAFILAAAVVSIIFMLLSEVETCLYEGGTLSSTLRYVLPLAVLVALSVAANLTVIYTKFVGPAVLQEEIESKQAMLDGAEGKLKALVNADSGTKKRTEISALLETVLSEISSPGKPGHGQRTERALRDLEAAMGVKLNRHAGSALKGPDALEVLMRRYRQDVAAQMDRVTSIQTSKARMDAIDKFLKGIEASKPKLDTALQAVRAKDPGAENLAVVELSKATALLKAIQANAAAIGLGPAGLGHPVEFENDAYGSIKHSLQSAFSHLHWPVTWLAIMLALAIDLTALLLVLVMTKPKTELLPGVVLQEVAVGAGAAGATASAASWASAADGEPHSGNGTTAGDADTAQSRQQAEPGSAARPPRALQAPREGYLPELPYLA